MIQRIRLWWRDTFTCRHCGAEISRTPCWRCGAR